MTPDEEKNKEQQNIETQDYNKQIDSAPMFDYAAFSKNYQSGEKPFMDALMEGYVKPEQRVSPEQEKKIRRASALTDGLVSIAEILGHASGVKIRDRSKDKTNQQQTTERLEKDKDRYEQDLLRYNSTRANAQSQDFAQQLRAEMNRHSENRQTALLKAEDGRRTSERTQAREWKKEDEANKIEIDRSQALWKRDNIDIPNMELTDKYDQRKVSRRKASTPQRNTPTEKNVFEISVPQGTAGAEFDQYTGKWYKSESISPARQQSILSGLPGGKTNYVEKNNLFREQLTTDALGQTRTSQAPFSDAEIVKHFLENDYRKIAPQWKKTHPATYATPALNEPQQPATNQSQQRGNVR